MKSVLHGIDISGVEVGNVSKHGFWLLVDGRELFLSFKDFPWFEDAPIRRLLNVQLLHAHHLYWPDLDVDLSVESVEHPERFPLTNQVPLKKNRRPAARARAVGKRTRPARQARSR